jgi:hypothetical protein
MSIYYPVLKIIEVTGCRADCPYTRMYMSPKEEPVCGCQYKYGPLPENGVADWCPLHTPSETGVDGPQRTR